MYVGDICDCGEIAAEYSGVFCVLEESGMMRIFVILLRLWENIYAHITEERIRTRPRWDRFIFTRRTAVDFHPCLTSRTARHWCLTTYNDTTNLQQITDESQDIHCHHPTFPLSSPLSVSVLTMGDSVCPRLRSTRLNYGTASWINTRDYDHITMRCLSRKQ